MSPVRPPLARPALPRLIAAIWRSRSGSIMPMAAMAIFAVAALIGGAIDISRAWKVQTRLQAACDAAVLAGRRGQTTGGFDASAQTQASAYFWANFDEAAEAARSTAFSATSAEKDNTVIATASSQLPPVMMQIFGFGAFDLSANCTASMGVGNSDVTMVLDTTGSMDSALSGSSQTRIQALRAAMKNFYDTLAAATTGTNARIRYGIVPYSSSVNVGRLLHALDPAYLADSWTIQSRKALYKQVQTFDKWGTPTTTSSTGTSSTSYGSYSNYSSTRYSTLTACNAAKPADTAWTNNGSSTTSSSSTTNSSGQKVTTTTVSQPQRSTTYSCTSSGGSGYGIQWRYANRTFHTTTTDTSDPVYTTTTTFDRWEYRPVTYDTSLYKAFESVSTPTGTSGAAQFSTWAGCIEERQTVSDEDFAYSGMDGITPAGAADLDIDSPPSNTATQWAPMWPDVAYLRTVTYSGNVYLNDAVPSAQGQLARSYCPAASRLLGTMSKSDFYAYADSLTAAGATYHDIGMIWGARISSPDGIWADNVNDIPGNGGEVSRHMIFMTDGEMAPSYSIQSSYGIEYFDRRVTDNGYTHDTERHNARFAALCEAVKAKGIRVWVIAFAQGLTSQLQACASDDSAFTAANAAQLDAAFQEIAKQVGELRVVQ